MEEKKKPYWLNLSARCYLQAWCRATSAESAVDELAMRCSYLEKRINDLLRQEGLDAELVFDTVEDYEPVSFIKDGKIEWKYGDVVEVLKEDATPADEEGGDYRKATWRYTGQEVEDGLEV